MNKIDLIIDALELAIKETQHPSLCIDKFDEALAAAHELKALKPVARVNSEGFIVELGLGLSSGTKIYALDEVMQ